MLGINTEFKDFLLTCNQKFVCLAVYLSNLDNFMTVILVHSFFNLLGLVIVQTHIAREEKALSYPLVLQARQVLRHQVYLKKFSESPTEVDARGPPRNRKLQEKVQNEQNKLIRLADKPEVGWLMVNEYVTDGLASDSGDDAKIRKAEKRAKEKIDKKRRQQIYRSSQPRSASANPVQPGIPSSYTHFPNNGQGDVPYGQQPARRPTFRPF